MIDVALPRFAQDRIDVDPSGCWLWTGSIQKAGYGIWGDHLAHRRIYALLIESLPAWSAAADGIELDHLCRVRRCVNPAHLEPVARRENVARGDSPIAEVSRRTHCPQGHPLTEGNLIKSRLPHRQCRECHLKHQRAWRERNSVRRRSAGNAETLT